MSTTSTIEVGAGAPDRPWSSLVAAIALIAAQHGLDRGEVTAALERLVPGDRHDPAKAAAAAGLAARALRLDWAEAATLDGELPALLRLRDGRVVVLLEIVRGDKVTCGKLLDPLQPDRPATLVDGVRLAAHWAGETYLLAPATAGARERPRFSLGWILRVALRDRAIVRDIMITAAIVALFSLFAPLLYMIVVDRVLVHQRVATLAVLVGAIVLVVLFETAFGWLRRHLLSVLAGRIDLRLGEHVFDRLVALPLDVFERTPAGVIVHKLSELRRIRHFVTGQLLGTILDATTLVVLIPAMIVLSPPLALYVLGVAAVMAAVVLVYIGPIRAAYAALVQGEQRRQSLLVETVHGMRTVKSLVLEGVKRREWQVRQGESVAAATRLLQLSNQPQTILAPLERAIYAGSLALGAWLVITQAHSVNAGTLIAFTMIATRVGQPFVQLAGLLQQIQETRAAIAQIASLVDLPEEGRGRRGARPLIRGEITVEGLTFRYDGAAVPALDRIDLAVRPGTLVGVMGRSGSGKSTLVSILQGLRPGYDGIVRLDGVELREIELAHLRRHLGVVGQEAFLFRGTIRENILAGRPDLPAGRLFEAARLAGAEEFIERLPAGYDTMIDEGSSNLSGGQRQRIAIARALFADPPVLLLDEATSALDPDSEAIVNASLRRLGRGRTVIVVSHRLRSLVACDQILVLDRGRLVAAGTHPELLGRCELYRHLWTQQNGPAALVDAPLGDHVGAERARA